MATGFSGQERPWGQRNNIQKLAPLLKGEGPNDALVTESRWTYEIIKTIATTVVFEGPGVVGFVHVIGGTLGNVTGYDNIAGSGTDVIPTTTPAQNDDMIPEPIVVGLGFTVVTAAATYVLVGYRKLS